MYLDLFDDTMRAICVAQHRNSQRAGEVQATLSSHGRIMVLAHLAGMGMHLGHIMASNPDIPAEELKRQIPVLAHDITDDFIIPMTTRGYAGPRQQLLSPAPPVCLDRPITKRMADGTILVHPQAQACAYRRRRLV